MPNIVLDFTQPYPPCSAMECPLLPSPLNGMVMVVGNTLGSIAIYHCLEGHILTGTMVRTCELTGLWSGEEPSCLRMCVCLSVCLFATMVRTCELTGLWSGEEPSCLRMCVCLFATMVRTCELTGLWSGEEPSCLRMCVCLSVCHHGADL